MYLTNRMGVGCGLSYIFIYFLTPISKNVLLINRVRYMKLDSRIVHDERLTW